MLKPINPRHCGLTKMKKSILFIAFVSLLIVGGYLSYNSTKPAYVPENQNVTQPQNQTQIQPLNQTLNLTLTQPQPEPEPQPQPEPQPLDTGDKKSHFGFNHPKHLDAMEKLDVIWQRPHPGPFIWNEIEKTQGEYTWVKADSVVKDSQKYGVNIMATIWPFAEWDQATVNKKLEAKDSEMFDMLGEYRGKPGDMDAYSLFVSAVVERYDGDGIEDMPGLTIPIKYWEVSNEPSMQEMLVFFRGTPGDYMEILEATYNAVKTADPESFVVQGGVAGLHPEATKFWDQVYAMGGADFFDIGNIHSIGHGTDSLNSWEYREHLGLFNIDKPFWVTEASFGNNFDQKQRSGEEWAGYVLKSYVMAFSAGVDKIFYTGLEESPPPEETWLLDRYGPKEMYDAFETMVDKLDGFTSVEKIRGDLFVFEGEKTVYVSWGTAPELNGELLVTHWDGTSETVDASALELGDEPVYIEEL